jgi:hypothetical protein
VLADVFPHVINTQSTIGLGPARGGGDARETIKALITDLERLREAYARGKPPHDRKDWYD